MTKEEELPMGILTKVYEIYKKCDIYLFPINCLDIIRRLNIKAVPYSSLTFKKQVALLEVSMDAYRIGDTIYYNDDRRTHVEGRIRFNLMHELGHIVMGHTEESEYNEECANWFAGEILAPTIIVYKCFDINEDSAQSAIANSFNISYEAAETKIKICKAAKNYGTNYFRPPDVDSFFPHDLESLKLLARFCDDDLDKPVYRVDICDTCWKELYNGEECTECKIKRLKYGSRSMFDEGYLFG